MWESLTQTIQIQPLGAESISVRYSVLDADCFTVHFEEGTQLIRRIDHSNGLIEINGNRQIAQVVSHGDRQISVFAERAWHFTLPDPLSLSSAGGESSDQILAPMPGQVKVVNVTEGDTVAAGDVLLVLEAMKMEHALTAPESGSVEMLGCQLGDQVDVGAMLIKLKFDGVDSLTQPPNSS